MNNIEIPEGNTLIAEFMGATETDFDELGTGFLFPEMQNYFPRQAPDLEELHYHKSWDWLMPVVDKICSLNYPRTDKKFRGIKFDSNKVYVCSNINYAYLGVIKFIKNYNKTLS